MAQVDNNTGTTDQIVEILAENEEVATTASFVTCLDVDARRVRDGELIIHNNAGGDLDYQVLATVKDFDTVSDPTGTDDDDKGWIVHTSASQATTAAPDEITIAKTYSRLIVQIKHTTLTTNVDVWFRGVR